MGTYLGVADAVDDWGHLDAGGLRMRCRARERGYRNVRYVKKWMKKREKAVEFNCVFILYCTALVCRSVGDSLSLSMMCYPTMRQESFQASQLPRHLHKLSGDKSEAANSGTQIVDLRGRCLLYWTTD